MAERALAEHLSWFLGDLLAERSSWNPYWWLDGIHPLAVARGAQSLSLLGAAYVMADSTCLMWPIDVLLHRDATQHWHCRILFGDRLDDAVSLKAFEPHKYLLPATEDEWLFAFESDLQRADP